VGPRQPAYDSTVSGTVKSAELDAFIKKVDALPPSNRTWVLPIYHALAKSDGKARPREVEDRIYEILAGKIRPGQWAHATKTHAIRFTRKSLVELGGLGGARGEWEWTPLGMEFWKRMRREPLRVPTDLPELGPEETHNVDAPSETVEATSRHGYEIPILRLLAEHSQKRREIHAAFEDGRGAELLPGDFRIAPSGLPVYRTRASLALFELASNGEVKKVGHGDWEITDAGRARLHAERATWTIERYRGSHAKVRQNGAGSEEATVASEEDEDDDDSSWHPAMWEALRDQIEESVFRAVDSRLRPDLGPSPDGLVSPIPRNLILYGPPGTGKTFTAVRIGSALTGEARPADGSRFQIVQFHPSYSYEDFVRGLRPDLEQKGGLHYRYHSGPLLQICERAAEDPDRFFVLVIDEINRGDPARIFGETLFAMEYRGQTVSLATGAPMIVPPNLVIIGTMNSVDRSIALMDFALRRRFGFVYLPPALAVVRSRFAQVPGIDHAVDMFERLNAWLRKRLGQEHALGHSFLLNSATPLDRSGSLDVIWRVEIRPLLEEYLFHDRDGLTEIEGRWNEWRASARQAGFDP
jgi:5-methylcytosine-specific restriction protein B